MSSVLITRKSIVLFALHPCNVGILVGIFLFGCALAQSQSKPPDPVVEILGTWEGESKCTIADSPCHDEHVVYEIASDKGKAAPVQLKLDGYKVVKGERQFMGTLRCEYNPARKILSCTSRGKEFDDWQYALSDGSLHGTLKIDSGRSTLFGQNFREWYAPLHLAPDFSAVSSYPWLSTVRDFENSTSHSSPVASHFR